ncbi:family transcriptional regulator, putative [Babesia ovata]|uniref:Family transcriptional regulator, putative n=1 Tax=Babesia ovata TaxID=189622 RepID=A0A2H6K8G2_9APIC|nr:family transcriptional regulator, putative [Babesia ovata]GBE59239.1 family transcriptional regulator, putative [Babesia ovata]
MGDVECCDKPECDDGVEEWRSDLPQKVVTLVEQFSEIFRVDDITQLRAEGEACCMLRYQGRCVPEGEAVLVERRHHARALDDGRTAAAVLRWHRVKDAVAAPVTGPRMQARVTPPVAAGHFLEDVLKAQQ